METSLSCIQSRIIAIAHFFINESQKNEIFFEKYLHLESYLTILRKHKELLGDAKYNRYLELEYYVTVAAIKSAINLDDFNRKHKFPSELLLELDEMDFDISKCREVQEITGRSMVENNIAAKTIRSFWENSNMLKYQSKMSKKMSLSFKLQSGLLQDLYIFINLGRIGSYELCFGMLNPLFSIDIGVLTGSSSYYFATIEGLHNCLAKTNMLLIGFLPYFEKIFSGEKDACTEITST